MTTYNLDDITVERNDDGLYYYGSELLGESGTSKLLFKNGRLYFNGLLSDDDPNSIPGGSEGYIAPPPTPSFSGISELIWGSISGNINDQTDLISLLGSLDTSSGTVNSVSISLNNGISGLVVNPTTNPLINLYLGNITPLSISSSGNITGANISGNNTGDQFTSVTTSRLIGRGSGGGGPAQEISLGSGLLMTGSVLSVDFPSVSLGGSGTVSSVSMSLNNGMSGVVNNSTTTPTLNIYLGSITPSSIAATGTVTGSNLTGTNTGDQFTSVTANRLLGRVGTVGAAQEIDLGSGLSFTGTTINVNFPPGNTGTVTSVSLSGNNGVSGIITNSTTTPGINLYLGNITPSKVTIPNGANNLDVRNDGTKGIIGTTTNNNFNIITNNTDAVIIDNSQVARFVNGIGLRTTHFGGNYFLTGNGNMLFTQGATLYGFLGKGGDWMGGSDSGFIFASYRPTFYLATNNSVTPTVTINSSSVSINGNISATNLTGTNTGDQYTTTTASRLIGRGTSGAGAAQEINLGVGLSMSGTTLYSTITGGGGSGTITSISAVFNNGMSGIVNNSTTTPQINLYLGNITPNSVAATGNVTGSNLSGTNTGDQFTTTTSATLLGRTSISSGPAQEILPGSGLTMAGTTLNTIGLLAAGSNLVELTSPSIARQNLNLDVWSPSFYWSIPVNTTIVWYSSIRFAGTINSLHNLKTSSGTLTLSIQINGTNVTGLSSLSVSSTPQSPTATAANTFNIGDRITVVISGVSSPADLEFSMKITR